LDHAQHATVEKLANGFANGRLGEAEARHEQVFQLFPKVYGVEFFVFHVCVQRE
jgi:hypothetical protein